MEKEYIQSFVQKYIYSKQDENNKLHCNLYLKEDDNFYKFINALKQSQTLDLKSARPDGYYFDNQEKNLYVFEHFEFDCSPHTRKGSTLRKNIDLINDQLNNEINNNQLKAYSSTKVIEQSRGERVGNKTIYYVGQNGDKFRNYYIENFKTTFEHHAKNLNTYVENCKKQINQSPFKIITAFIIEDVTLGGTYYKKGKEIVDLLQTKQFLDLFKISNLDFVIFGMLNKTYLSICDKTIINDKKQDFVDLNNNEFYILPSMPVFTFYN